MPPRDGKCYRFGICGGPSSGKTCILAALAMLRESHPLGYNTILVPPTKEDRTRRKTGLPTPRERGWEWVVEGWDAKDSSGQVKHTDGAKERLLKGGVPGGNQNESNRMLLRYLMTKADGTEIPVELIDYSGELMSEKGVASERATRLRADLLEMDGLLVVAAHPREGEGQNALAMELNNFLGAYAALRDEAVSKVPVALLINMWDRAGTRPELPKSREPEAREQEYRSLLMTMADQFLDSKPSPPHVRIRDTLRGAAGEGFFASFPVSAFGANERVTITTENGESAMIERPMCSQPLDSFGLEDPFIWLIERRDEMDIKALESKATLGKIMFSPGHADACRKDASALLTRMTEQSPRSKDVKAVVERVNKIRRRQNAALVVSLLVLLFGVEYAIDDRAHRLADDALNDSSRLEGYDDCIAWYENYLQSPSWRHLVYRGIYPVGEAAKKLDVIRAGREEHHWNACKAAEDPQQRKEFLLAFCNQFPNSAHIPDAHSDLFAIKKIEDVSSGKAKLERAKDEIDSLKKWREKLRSEPKPNYVDILKKANDVEERTTGMEKTLAALGDEALSTAVRAALKDINNLVILLSIDDGDAKKRIEYHDHMAHGSVLAAGNLVLETAQRRNDFKDLWDHYTLNAGTTLETSTAGEAAPHGGWKKALKTLVTFKEGAPASSDLLANTSIRQLIVKLEKKYTNMGDEQTYIELANDSSNVAKLQGYLAEFPQSVMRTMVERKIAFLKLANEQQRFRVTPVRIVWGAHAAEADSTTGVIEAAIEFRMNGLPGGDQKKRLDTGDDATDGKTPWPDYGKALDVPGVQFYGTAVSYNVSLTVELFDEDGFTWDSLGSGTISTRLTDWDDGIATTTVGLGSYHGGNRVSFLVEYEAAEGWKTFANPTLPLWRPEE